MNNYLQEIHKLCQRNTWCLYKECPNDCVFYEKDYRNYKFPDSLKFLWIKFKKWLQENEK